METLENILWIVSLICLSLLALASAFIWHNAIAAVLFTMCVAIWIIGTYKTQ